MSSSAQIEANRSNAVLSTGPKTASGKSRASKNAVRHGLRSELPVLPCEQADDWLKHREGILRSLSPAGTLEQQLAERVALCLWRLRRAAVFETAAATIAIESVPDETRRLRVEDDVSFSFGEPNEAREQNDAEEELEKARALLQEAERDLALVELVTSGADDAAPVDGQAAGNVLETIGNLPPEDRAVDGTDDAFLVRVGIPQDELENCWDWDGWTVGMVRKGLNLIANLAKFPAEKLQVRLSADAREDVEEKGQKVRDLQRQVKDHRQRVKAMEERKRRKRILPDDSTINKVLRYEAHVSRQMLQALHTLERLQAARAGADVPPPAALDVTVDGPSAALETALENASQL
jgi:hypothetical protein